MRLITFLLSCFCLFTAIATKAETFTVVNNNISGAASLRQALLDAASNGEVEQDYIQFNLADQTETGRTITVLMALPDLTSNLTIDGSTQSGLVFGLSTAKVAVNFDMPGTLKRGFKMTEKENIAI